MVNPPAGNWGLDSETVKQYHCSLRYLCDVFPQKLLSAREEKALGIMRSTLVEEACEASGKWWPLLVEGPLGYNMARGAEVKAASPLCVTLVLRLKSCAGWTDVLLLASSLLG